MRRMVLISLLVLAAGPVLAQPPAEPAKAPPPQVDPVTTIMRIDANHDGKITAAELAAYRDAHKPAAKP